MKVLCGLLLVIALAQAKNANHIGKGESKDFFDIEKILGGMFGRGEAETEKPACALADGTPGVCTDVEDCDGVPHPGQCPGPASVQCCTAHKSCQVGDEHGVCIATGKCEGKSVSGHCPGPSHIQCCTPEKSSSWYNEVWERAENFWDDFVEEKDEEDESESESESEESDSDLVVDDEEEYPSYDFNPDHEKYSSCSVPMDGNCNWHGHCMDVGECDGESHSGKCSGPANIQCCTPKLSFNSPSNSANSTSAKVDNGKCVTRVSDLAAGIEIIQTMESCSLNAIVDPHTGGEPITIGWGTTFRAGGNGKWELGDYITKAKADQLFAEQIAEKFLPIISKRIPTWCQMNKNQQSAILSFSYNVGAYFYGLSKFKTISSFLDDPNKWGPEIRSAFLLHVNKGSRTEKGLTRRRNAECDLWLTRP